MGFWILDFGFRISDWNHLKFDKIEIPIPQSAIPNPQSIHSNTPLLRDLNPPGFLAIFRSIFNGIDDS